MTRNVFRIRTFPDRYGYRIRRIVWKIKYILLGFLLILSWTDRRYPYGCLGIKRHRKTGPIIWSMSGSANNLLRQLGLLLFLSEVGTSAGVNLVSTFQSSGLTLFGVGIAITMIPMIIAVLAGYYFFKINILDLVGTIAGGMTSTPGLAAADSMTDSPAPSVAYATVYPIAMVFLILFIQMIANLIV